MTGSRPGTAESTLQTHPSGVEVLGTAALASNLENGLLQTKPCVEVPESSVRLPDGAALQTGLYRVEATSANRLETAS